MQTVQRPAYRLPLPFVWLWDYKRQQWRIGRIYF